MEAGPDQFHFAVRTIISICMIIIMTLILFLKTLASANPTPRSHSKYRMTIVPTVIVSRMNGATKRSNATTGQALFRAQRRSEFQLRSLHSHHIEISVTCKDGARGYMYLFAFPQPVSRRVQGLRRPSKDYAQPCWAGGHQSTDSFQACHPACHHVFCLKHLRRLSSWELLLK